jgi:hypothetical protein
MKTYLAGLQNSVQTTYSNNGKTTILGRAFQKSINSQSVIGPALTNFIDVQTQAAFGPGLVYYVPSQNLLFVAQSSTAATMIIAAYNFNNTTGVNSYIGKVTLNFANSAATTNTVRGFVAWSDGTNVRLMIQQTGSVAVNSGVYVAYCPLSAFTIGGSQLYAASGSGQNAIYLLQASDYVGVNAVTGFANLGWGMDYPYMSSNSAVNTKLFTVCNTVAAPVVQSWDLATTPTVAGISLNNVSSLTGGYAVATYGQPTLAYFNMPSWLFYQGNTGADPVVLMNGTVPVAGMTAWTAGTLQSTTNVYFTRDVFQTYTFTCSALSSGITAAATYQVTGVASSVITLTANITYLSGVTSIILSTPNYTQVPSSGTLTLLSGTGPATITYSAATSNGVYFNLAATTGGVAVTTATTASGFTMMRAFGTSNNQYYARTASMAALSGTILQANGVSYAKPVSAPANTALQGQDCLTFPTVSNLYMGKLSDLFFSYSGVTTTYNSTTVTGLSSTTGLTAGMLVVGPGIVPGTTISTIASGTSITLSNVAYLSGTSTITIGTNAWGSLTFVNATGTGTDYIAPTMLYSRYGAQGLTNDVDKFVYPSFTSSFFFKSLQSSVLSSVFGGVTSAYYETLNPTTIQFGATTVLGMELRSGWLFITASGIGQRGIQFCDIWSDSSFGNSGVISPVLNISPGSILKYVDSLEQLFDSTNSINFWIRSATTSSDVSFNSGTLPIGSPVTSGVTSNGWTSLKTAADLAAYAVGPYFQLCATYTVMAFESQTPGQLNDIEYTVILPTESSDNWAMDNDNTTQGSGTPSYVSYRLQTAYSTSVPTLYARVYDTNGNLIFSANTSSNPTSFQYSTNAGLSWSSLGTIPNTVDTRVRFNVNPVPVVTVAQPSLRES